MSFGSGSSGNCSYIGDRDSGFLIDAGVDARKVMADLHKNGIPMDRVKGIIITHDHHDHISQAYHLLRANRHIRFYCTPALSTASFAATTYPAASRTIISPSTRSSPSR